MGFQITINIETRRGTAARHREHLTGWLTSDQPIAAVVMEAPGTDHAEPFRLGYPRADVAHHFKLPEAQATGYFLDLPAPVPDRAGLWVQLEGSGIWYRAEFKPVAHATHAISFSLLNRRWRVPAAVTTVAGRCRDDDARFMATLRATPGLTLRLDLINKCNLRCVMCHYSRDEISKRPAKSLSLDAFKTMFDALGGDVRDVVLSCADEPLMSRHFSAVLAYLASEHPQVRVMFCTNTMLMTAPIRRAIVESGVAKILLSVDAVTKTMLESIRVGSRFERVISHIKALADLKTHSGAQSPEMIIDFVMMRRNLHHGPAMVRAAKAMGVGTIDFRHVVMTDTATDMDHELLTHEPARFNHYRARILAEAERHGMRAYLTPELPTHDTWVPGPDEPAEPADETTGVPSDFHPDELSHPLPLRAPVTLSSMPGVSDLFAQTYCNRPFSEVMIRNQDEVLPCPWHARALGRLSQTPVLSEIFLGPEFQALRRNMLKPEGDPGCRGCPLKTNLLPSKMRDYSAARSATEGAIEEAPLV